MQSLEEHLKILAKPWREAEGSLITLRAVIIASFAHLAECWTGLKADQV